LSDEKDLAPARELIRMSHCFFADKNGALQKAINDDNGQPIQEKRTLKLFVIGATGRTGGEIVQQALAKGHSVTAFVRAPEKIVLKSEGLNVLKGDAMNEDQLAAAMQDHDAVLTTLGPREVFKRSSMMHDSALATAHAMRRAGVKRLVVLSASAHFPGIPNRIASFILRNHMRDSLAMEAVVTDSGLDWTIARPPRLTSEDSVTYRSRVGAAPRMAFTLSRKAVGAFMLNAVEQRSTSDKSSASQNNHRRPPCTPPFSPSLF
jgi:Trk K+ transport system NAD-binding subunit